METVAQSADGIICCVTLARSVLLPAYPIRPFSAGPANSTEANGLTSSMATGAIVFSTNEPVKCMKSHRRD